MSRSTPHARHHLLVVEDEFVAALALEDFLTHKGYRVTLATDGIEALRHQAADPVAAVLTDLRMPRMNGQDLIRRLRAADPDLPIIAMTGYTALETEAVATAGQAPGRMRVLRKPVDLDEIAAVLRGMLSDQAARRPVRTGPGTDAPDRRRGS